MIDEFLENKGYRLSHLLRWEVVNDYLLKWTEERSGVLYINSEMESELYKSAESFY